MSEYNGLIIESSHPSMSIGKRFVLFFLLLVVFLNMTAMIQPEAFCSRLVDLTSCLSSVFLNAIGISASWERGFVTVSGYKLEMNAECTALPFLLIYIAGVIAYPLHKSVYKLKGVIIGCIFLVLVNILRIITLGVIGANFERNVLDMVHAYLWQGGYVIIMALTWFVWTRNELFSKPLFRFGLISIIVSIILTSLLGYFMQPYLHVLAKAANSFLFLAGKGMVISATDNAIVFENLGIQTNFPLSVDVFDSVIFFALIAASADKAGKTEVFRALLIGGVLLSITHLLFVLIIGQMVSDRISDRLSWEIMWILRGVSLVTPLLLALFAIKDFTDNVS